MMMTVLRGCSPRTPGGVVAADQYEKPECPVSWVRFRLRAPRYGVTSRGPYDTEHPPLTRRTQRYDKQKGVPRGTCYAP
jgi:hypothetical protein